MLADLAPDSIEDFLCEGSCKVPSMCGGTEVTWCGRKAEAIAKLARATEPARSPPGSGGMLREPSEPMNLSERIRCALALYESGYKLDVAIDVGDIAELLEAHDRLALQSSMEGRREEIAREATIEECAKIAEQKMGGYLCPYGRDKPGDDTWTHTDDDKCPVCGCNSADSLFRCHDTASGRITAAIRALAHPRPVLPVSENEGESQS